MVVIFPYNSWSVNSDRPKKGPFAHAQRSHEDFNLKMFATKFCYLGQTFISIAQVVLNL